MTIDVGVIGVGSMGRHHARVAHELPGAELVGVADVDEEHAVAVAEEFDTGALSNAELLESVEAVSVAVPTPFHHEVALDALEAGVHVLVEKPIARTVAEASELVEVAHSLDLTLQVGHVERFNPAVRSVRRFVDDLDIVAVDARRLGPPIDGDRALTEGVVLDLMIHDLDIIRSLIGAEVTEVTASGRPDGEYVAATLGFENDVVGSVTASRITQRKVRELTLTTTESQITIDYIDRSVRIHRRTRPEFRVDDGELRYRTEQVVERPTVGNGEPLKREFEAFLEAVRNGTTPVVTGRDGLEALSLARRVETALQRGPPDLGREHVAVDTGHPEFDPSHSGRADSRRG